MFVELAPVEPGKKNLDHQEIKFVDTQLSSFCIFLKTNVSECHCQVTQGGGAVRLNSINRVFHFYMLLIQPIIKLSYKQGIPLLHVAHSTNNQTLLAGQTDA